MKNKLIKFLFFLLDKLIIKKKIISGIAGEKLKAGGLVYKKNGKYYNAKK